MHALPECLLLFAVLYAAYSLSTFPFPQREIDKELERIPKGWVLAPVRLLAWVLLLPLASMFEALLLAFVAFSIGGLMIAIH